MQTYLNVQTRQKSVTRRKEFQDYLEESVRNPFVLNLKDKTLMEVIDAAINAKSKRSKGYKKQLSCLKYNLKEIENLYQTELKTIQITDIFWDFFVSFCDERKLKTSSTLTIANQLRSILNWASKHGALLSPTYDEFKISKKNGVHIALTADEISRIAYFDIDRFYSSRRADFKETMKRVRDMFILACNLGQRYSDMRRIKPECFERNIFSITQQKTGSKAVVDIDKFSIDSKTAYRILNEYGYSAPYNKDISNYNHHLHQLMKDIGFLDDIMVEERQNGAIVSKTLPKWQLISSHTARRSFITINVLRGNNIHSIKRASGHADSRCFEGYIRDE